MIVVSRHVARHALTDLFDLGSSGERQEFMEIAR